MSPKRHAAAALACGLLTVSLTESDGVRSASLGSPYFQQVLSVYADLVVLHVRVENDGQAFAGLAADNFEVFEDEKRQTIRFVGAQDEPVTAGLLVDDSSSMLHNRDRVIAAGLQFALRRGPRDELFVIHFDEHLTFGLPPEMAFTSNLTALQSALTRMTGRGKTALYDAIAAGLEHLQGGTWQRRALILVSDGGDNASQHTLSDVLNRARRSDVLIFGVGVIDPYADGTNPRLLKELTTATGGEVWIPRRVQDVHSAFEQIAEDLRARYTLGYMSTNVQRDGTYRKIRVVARDARGHRLSVRTRAGYIAASGTRSLE